MPRRLLGKRNAHAQRSFSRAYLDAGDELRNETGIDRLLVYHYPAEKRVKYWALTPSFLDHSVDITQLSESSDENYSAARLSIYSPSAGAVDLTSHAWVSTWEGEGVGVQQEVSLYSLDNDTSEWSYDVLSFTDGQFVGVTYSTGSASQTEPNFSPRPHIQTAKYTPAKGPSKGLSAAALMQAAFMHVGFWGKTKSFFKGVGDTFAKGWKRFSRADWGDQLLVVVAAASVIVAGVACGMAIAGSAGAAVPCVSLVLAFGAYAGTLRQTMRDGPPQPYIGSLTCTGCTPFPGDGPSVVPGPPRAPVTPVE